MCTPASTTGVPPPHHYHSMRCSTAHKYTHGRTCRPRSLLVICEVHTHDAKNCAVCVLPVMTVLLPPGSQPGHIVLQVQPGQPHAGPAVEQVLGQHAGVLPAHCHPRARHWAGQRHRCALRLCLSSPTASRLTYPLHHSAALHLTFHSRCHAQVAYLLPLQYVCVAHSLAASLPSNPQSQTGMRASLTRCCLQDVLPRGRSPAAAASSDIPEAPAQQSEKCSHAHPADSGKFLQTSIACSA